MKKKLLRTLGFLHNFGFLKGMALLIQTNLKHISQLKLPNVKHPITLRKNTSDLPTFLQVFIDREYKINFTDPKVVLDCGANVGLFAIYMKSVFPDTKIICIEPDPENFEVLHKNLKSYSNVHFENCGVWNKDTKLKVYDKYNAGKWGMIVEEDLQDGKIPAISIKTLIEKYEIEYIDVLKMDIESSEKQVFTDHYIDWLPKVKNIVIELHDFLEEGCSKTFFEAINRSFDSYEMETKGENIIIRNKSFRLDQSKQPLDSSMPVY